jgi:hypothetical protein
LPLLCVNKREDTALLWLTLGAWHDEDTINDLHITHLLLTNASICAACAATWATF